MHFFESGGALAHAPISDVYDKYVFMSIAYSLLSN